MVLLFDLELPLTDPVLIFSLVLFIILLTPFVLRKLRIPGILGLILAGMIIGPFGFNILRRDDSIILFGTVGLLYIMFLAGLELEINEFRKNRNKSLIFGLLTFAIPMGLGFPVCYYLLGMDQVASVLAASMLATHTMIAYPLAGRFGITKNEAVIISVGGTIVADTLVLLLLAVITGMAEGTLNPGFWTKLSISIVLFIALVFLGFPLIGRWFFKKVEGEKTSQYIFVMAMVFLAAFLAELAGIEPIIGAFMAGLALNRLIPHTSSLMNRIEFVGSAFFIPFFLIDVGMRVDLKAIFTSSEALITAGVLTVVAVASKWLAAWVMQLIYGYSAAQRKMIFGLTNSRVAATLAVILIGYEMGIVNENVLNGTIMLILITCLIASFTAESAARKLAVVESTRKPDPDEHPKDRILVPLSNPATVEERIDYALCTTEPGSPVPIYPLAVVRDDEKVEDKFVESEKMLEKALKHASATETPVERLTRVDMNVSSGIIRAAKDNLISHILMGWVERSVADRFFGSILDNLIQGTGRMISVVRFAQPMNTVKKILVVVPRNAQLETGFHRWTTKVKNLVRQSGAGLLVYCHADLTDRLKDLFTNQDPTVTASFKELNDWSDFLVVSNDMEKDIMLMAICARPGTVSYNAYMDHIPARVRKRFPDNNLVIVFPEQDITLRHPHFESEGFEMSSIQENLQRISKLGRSVKKIFKS